MHGAPRSITNRFVERIGFEDDIRPRRVEPAAQQRLIHPVGVPSPNLIEIHTGD